MGSRTGTKATCSRHSRHRIQGRPLDRSLCDGQVSVLYIWPCSGLYRVPVPLSSASATGLVLVQNDSGLVVLYGALIPDLTRTSASGSTLLSSAANRGAWIGSCAGVTTAAHGPTECPF